MPSRHTVCIGTSGGPHVVGATLQPTSRPCPRDVSLLIAPSGSGVVPETTRLGCGGVCSSGLSWPLMPRLVKGVWRSTIWIGWSVQVHKQVTTVRSAATRLRSVSPTPKRRRRPRWLGISMGSRRCGLATLRKRDVEVYRTVSGHDRVEAQPSCEYRLGFRVEVAKSPQTIDPLRDRQAIGNHTPAPRRSNAAKGLRLPMVPIVFGAPAPHGHRRHESTRQPRPSNTNDAGSGTASDHRFVIDIESALVTET